MDVLRRLWTSEEETGETRTTYQYVIDLRDRITETCQLAAKELEGAHEVNKKYFDKKTKDRKFRPGGKVLLLLTDSHCKLQLQWKGPFQVLEKVNDWDYKIQLPNKTRQFHANMLKKYEERKEVDVSAGIAIIDEHVLLADGGDELELPVYEGEQKETYQDVEIGEGITEEQTSQLKELIYEFRDIFSDVPGQTNLIEVELELETDRPVKCKNYPVPLALRGQLDEELDSMLRLGVIEPSNAPYASPVVMVKKQDGKSYRVCTDFRALNKVLKTDLEPIPRMEEIWTKLQGSQYYSKIDLSKGFWQLPVKSGNSRDILSFSTPRGLFRYKFLPFGLASSPAWFTRMMRKLLRGARDLEHFFDDILAHSGEWEDHLVALRDLFRRVREANLTLRPTKCHFGCPQLEFLGHTRTAKGFLHIKAKVDAILEIGRPQTKTQLQSFLGTVNFYSKFIPNYSSLAVPLTNLTKKREPEKLRWHAEHEQAFVALKTSLTQEPILVWPKFDEDFHLETDVSGLGIGAVLLQYVDGVKHPVLYASRKLLDRETRYSTIERELLAIIFAVQKFQLYLYGRRFWLETDHQPLTYLQTCQPSNHRLLRWALILQQYQINILSIKGSENHMADFLSRIHN